MSNNRLLLLQIAVLLCLCWGAAASSCTFDTTQLSPTSWLVEGNAYGIDDGSVYVVCEHKFAANVTSFTTLSESGQWEIYHEYGSYVEVYVQEYYQATISVEIILAA